MSLLFPLITFPYSSRILLPEGIGRVNFASSIISYFALFAGLGIGSYGVREAARIRNDHEKLSHFTQELFTLHLFTTAIAYALFIISLFVVPRFKEMRVLLCVSSGTILFSTFGINWLYSAVEEFEYIAIRSVFFQIFGLFLLFTLVKTQDDYLKYAAISVIGSFGSNILNLVHSRKYVTFRFNRELHIFRHLKPCLVFFGLALITSIYHILDKSVLGFMQGDRAVGIYVAANKVTHMLLSLTGALLGVLTPRLSFYAGQGESSLFRSTFRRAYSYSFGISIPIMIGLFLLARPIIIACSGGTYIDAVPVMRLLCPIAVTIPTAGLISGQLFVALRKERTSLKVYPCAAFLNLTLNIILIPHFGVSGAAFATVVAETSVAILMIAFARSYISFREIIKNIAQYVFSCVIMTIVVLACLHFFEKPLYQVFSSFILGAAVYFAILLLMRNAFAIYFFQFTLSKLRQTKDRFLHYRKAT